MKYCNQCELFPSYLSVYMDHHSTETILLKFVNDTLMNMDSQCITLLVSCDLSAVFNTVNNSILLNVFESCFGVKDTALSWFKDYLSGRSVQVQVNNKISSKKQVECGVPQGSCCGPVLLNVYVSTLDDYITNVNKLGYADDHGLYTSFNANNRNEEHYFIAILGNSLEKVKEWMALTKLKMNDTKTEVIPFGNLVQLKKCETTCIRVGTSNKEFEQCIKYLGVILDENPNLKKYIINKCNTASFNLHKIHKVSKNYSIENLKKNWYWDLLYPILTMLIPYYMVFLNLVSNLCNVSKTWQLKLILNRDNYSSSTDTLKELHQLPVSKLLNT